MKVLTFTSLYPNKQQPRHGIFVENRLLQLKQRHPQVEIHVVAPVPWFPFTSERFGLYGKYAKVAKSEHRSGITVHHPRYPVIPKIGMNVAPQLMRWFMLPVIKKIIADGYDFDVIDSHFFYPDGAVATWIGKKLKKPVTVTARGSDIHLYPQFKVPNKVIRWTLREADLPIAVCQALAEEMLQLEPENRRVEVCRNGVDLDKFTPDSDRQGLRDRLDISGFTLLSVGNLIELKGHHLVIEALQQLPEVNLIIIGDGPMRSALEQQCEQLQLQNRVTFTGLLNQQQLKGYYAAADAMILASSREGWANVLLESMACGTPVVATAIWGTPEVVASQDGGLLVQQRSAGEIAKTVQKLINNYPDRDKVRAYAEGFSWDATSDKLLSLYQELS